MIHAPGVPGWCLVVMFLLKGNAMKANANSVKRLRKVLAESQGKAAVRQFTLAELLGALDKITPGRWFDRPDGETEGPKAESPASLEELSEGQAGIGWLLAAGWVEPEDIGPGLLEKAIYTWSNCLYFQSIGADHWRDRPERDGLFSYMVERVSELCAEDPDHVRGIAEALQRHADRLPLKQRQDQPSGHSLDEGLAEKA